MACRGEASTSILAHAELKVQHTHSQQLCASTVPKGLGRDTNPWCFQRSSSRKAPHKLQAHRALCSWHKGGSVWGQELELFLGAAAEGTSCRRQVPQFQFKIHIHELLTKKPKQGPKKGHPALVFGS